MAVLVYHIFSSSALVSMGIYHLISSTYNFLKSPHSYSARPFHPFPPSSSQSNPHHNHHRLRYLQLYLAIVCLLILFLYQLLVSSLSDPLLKGSTPVHHFTSLQSAALLFLFLILALSLLLSNSSTFLPFPPDLFFALASALFFLHFSISSSAASVQTSDLQAKCDSVSARISALSSLLCMILSVQPRLFGADVALGAAIFLQGLWSLQTGLSLHVESFIPEGCHRLLDVVSGVERSTMCDLDESKWRAVAILDLAFLLHVMFVMVIVLVSYAVIAKTVGVWRLDSYEALPNASAVGDNNHIQMKAMSGIQA